MLAQQSAGVECFRIPVQFILSRLKVINGEEYGRRGGAMQLSLAYIADWHGYHCVFNVDTLDSRDGAASGVVSCKFTGMLGFCSSLQDCMVQSKGI
jgi:hypothetical protein